MKAFLLAAGYGTRLKPITDETPKCLVPINGRPLLEYWIDLFLKHGIDEVLINSHHLAVPLQDYISKIDRKIYFDVRYEKELLGSAGTLRKHKWFVRGESNFLICYADVLTNCDLKKLVSFHEEHDSKFTMAVARVGDPQNKGIVETNNGIITSFWEKPAEYKGDLANMGIYVCNSEVLSLIEEEPYSDIGIDLLPLLLGKMMAYDSNEYFCDIGTPENLKLAEQTWRQ